MSNFDFQFRKLERDDVKKALKFIFCERVSVYEPIEMKVYQGLVTEIQVDGKFQVSIDNSDLFKWFDIRQCTVEPYFSS